MHTKIRAKPKPEIEIMQQDLSSIQAFNRNVLDNLLSEIDAEALIAVLQENASHLATKLPKLNLEELVLSLEIGDLDRVHTQFNQATTESLSAADFSEINLKESNANESFARLIDIVRLYDALYTADNNVPDNMELVSEDELVERFKASSIEAGFIADHLVEYLDWDVAANTEQLPSVTINLESQLYSRTFYLVS